MKPAKSIAVALATLFAMLTAADAQEREPEALAPSREQLAQAATRVRGEIPAIAQSFGWTEPITVVAGPGVNATAEQISLNEPRLAAMVVGLSADDAEEAMRLIVAHEVWHFVELNRGGSLSRVGEERRVYECRADVMAGRYLTSRAAPGSLLTPYFSSASTLARRVWTTDTPDHPGAAQRQMAVLFGALTVAREAPGIDPARLEEIEGVLGYRADQSLDAWSRSACERLTHFGQQALASVVVDRPVFTQAGEDNNFSIAFANISARPIEVSANISVMHIPRPIEGGQYRNSRTFYFQRQFVIEPGARQIITGTVRQVADAQELYVSAAQNTPGAQITARFGTGGSPQAVRALGTGLSDEDIRFALAIERLSNDALNAFSHHRQGSSPSPIGDSLYFRSVIQVPAPATREETNIALRNDGSASVSTIMFRGDSFEDAQAAFARIRATFARIWPTAVIVDSSRTNEGRILPQFMLRIGRYARAEINLYSSYRGGFEIIFDLKPNALGLEILH